MIKLLTKRQFSEKSKIPESTLYRMIKNGLIREYQAPHRKTTYLSAEDLNTRSSK
jgi:predicted transcriptional regulator